MFLVSLLDWAIDKLTINVLDSVLEGRTKETSRDRRRDRERKRGRDERPIRTKRTLDDDWLSLLIFFLVLNLFFLPPLRYAYTVFGYGQPSSLWGTRPSLCLKKTKQFLPKKSEQMKIKGESWCQSRPRKSTPHKYKKSVQEQNSRTSPTKTADTTSWHIENKKRFDWMCLNDNKYKRWPDPIGEWSDQPLHLSDLHIGNSVWELGR